MRPRDEPARPIDDRYTQPEHTGLTKFEETVIRMMEGYLSNPEIGSNFDIKELAHDARGAATALWDALEGHNG